MVIYKIPFYVMIIKVGSMLRTLKEAPFKSLQTAHMDIARMNIFEIFIRMFVDEVFLIAKRGLKCSYESIEENTKFFKGKMLFSEQIKFNHSHKERSYVKYDDFTANRPENKLLKATLLYLYRRTGYSKNKKDIKTLLNIFDMVDASTNYKSDFSKCITDRNVKDYDTALRYSKVFLMGNSFTSFAGSEVATALLFPMEKLFEDYIADLIRRKLPSDEYEFSAPDRTYHLFDKPKKFLMKPDIVVKRKSDKAVFVLDTKWKLLNNDPSVNYGISQADMYQMYAYQKKYNAENITLLYPRTEKVPKDKDIVFISNEHEPYKDVIVQAKFIDLLDVDNSIQEVVKRF